MMSNVSLDSNLLRDDITASAAALGRDLTRTGVPHWSLWLGYLALGGTMSLFELRDTLGGTRQTSQHELYLMTQAHY